MSSNAATLGNAVLACADLQQLLRASHAVAALSFLALGGSAEAYASAVHEARPHPGQAHCASEMRRLLGIDECSCGRAPHPGSLRPPRVPPGAGARPGQPGAAGAHPRDRGQRPSREPAGRDRPPGEVFHHAHFHTAYVAVALDQARAAIHHVAELSAARLGDLVEPSMTNLSPFLSSGPQAAPGVMILEYVAHDTLAELRHAALPVTLGNAVVSRGLEDHASFSTQAARQATAGRRGIPARPRLRAGGRGPSATDARPTAARDSGP